MGRVTGGTCDIDGTIGFPPSQLFLHQVSAGGKGGGTTWLTLASGMARVRMDLSPDTSTYLAKV